jgi:mannosyltransferase
LLGRDDARPGAAGRTTRLFKENESLNIDMVDSERGTSRASQLEGQGPWPRYPVHASDAIAIVLTVTAIICAVVLRWFHLGGLSLWYDEGFTALASSYSPANVIRYAQSSDGPPLYFLLQHYWGNLFGSTEHALRALSALFGTLSLPLFYLLAKKILKDRLAVALAMWLFAFSIMQVWFSREARTYELASFLALSSFYALVQFLEKRSLALFAIIVLSVTATLYMHNMMFFYLFALNVIWLTYPSERPWTERLKELMLADALAAVLYLPWVPSLLTQIRVDVVQKSFWAPRPTVSTLFGTLSLLAGFYLDYLTAFAGKLLPLSSHMSWVCANIGVGVLCAALVIGGLWRVSKVDRASNISLLLYCLVPILMVFVFSSVTTPVYTDRIFLSSSIVLPIVFAYPLAQQKGRRTRLLYGVLGTILGATTALSGFGYLRYQEKEDWRAATGSLLKISNGNRLIVFVARSGEILFDYYAQRFPAAGPVIAKMGLPTSYLDQFPPAPYSAMTNESEFVQLKGAIESRKYSEIDLVLSHELYADPHNLVLTYLTQVLKHQEEQQFVGVKIVRFVVARD